MAKEENQEEIVIIEDSDAIEEQEQKEESTTEDAPKSKKIVFIVLGLLVFLVLLIIILVIIFKKEPSKTKASSEDIVTEIEEKSKKKITPSKLENMIAKANYLYQSGQKAKALRLYEYIAEYSEAISSYNLGVARMKKKQYKEAVESFNKAIANGQKVCVSAINAAVASLYLNDMKNFRYYINLADAFLPNEKESPLYNYYYALVKFYKRDYFEALAALDKADNKLYKYQIKHLKAKIDAMFGDDYKAIEALEDLNDHYDSFSKALLYARVGDLALAKDNFEDAYDKAINPKLSLAGLAFSQIKMGHIKNATENLKNLYEKYGDDIFGYFPIKVRLKESLFNPLLAQAQFRKSLQNDKKMIFSEIFYFSPYKVFNANKTINYMRKADASIFVESIDTAKRYLKQSVSTSSVNKGIVKAIKKALHFRIREANHILKQLVKIQPKHSILHYNLGLTYAQIGDFNNAYKHFLISYHQDAKNYISGVYAYMCSVVLNKTDTKLLSILKDSMVDEEDTKDLKMAKAFLDIANAKYINALDWAENNEHKKPLELIGSYIVAYHTNKMDDAVEFANTLSLRFRYEIVPQVLLHDAKYVDFNKPKYARYMNRFLKEGKFSYLDLYYGPKISREMFLKLHLLTGRTYELVQILKQKLNRSSDKDISDLEAALAQSLLYNQDFEESYVMYNHLIDELKVNDSVTLFLGATAAIASNHHSNAIALLELSKLKDKQFYETRFVLALLYYETKNLQGGNISLEYINSNNFISKFFTFDIDTDKLYQMYKEHRLPFSK